MPSPGSTPNFLRAFARLLFRCFVTLSFLIQCGSVSVAQTLADADWFVREVGNGVVWRHYLFDNLYSSKQSVSYIEADLNNSNVSVQFPYHVTAREVVSTMVPSQAAGAVAGINGTYFDTTNGGHRTYLRVDGAEIPSAETLFAAWGYEGALGINASSVESILAMPKGGWSRNTTHPNIIACGPLLIVDNSIPYSDLSNVGAHCTNRHPRSGVGITSDNRLIILTVDGRTDMAAGMTCAEFAETMQQLGCTNALNLDGGGSSTLWGAGELYNGVLNFPSDNGQYDHLGERSCANAIAIKSTPPTATAWDARLTSKTFSQLMMVGEQQTVSLAYTNIGTQTWSATDTRVILARPTTRTSPFYTSTWTSVSQPATMSPSTVAPGDTATFSFVMSAPDVLGTTSFDEHFMLYQNGVGRIGPADSEAWMRITVQTPVKAGETFLVESRTGGHNVGWYSDSGMANTATNCTAPGATDNIGSRYGSTYRSVAGDKYATAAPDFPDTALYNVYVAWGDGSNRRSPITYHVKHSAGTNTFLVDQTLTANTWVQLGSAPYQFDKGLSGWVAMTNENIDVSGSMYAAAFKFEYYSLPAPSGLTASAGDGSVTLDWLDNTQSNLAGYNVYRSTTSGGPYTKLNSALVTTSNYSDLNVSNSTTYFYTVTAVDALDKESPGSAQVSATPTGSDTTPPAAPTGLTATAGDANVSLDWANNTEPDLAGYNVYRSLTSGSGYAQLNASLLTASAFTDNSVTNGTTYYYVVSAVDTSSNESGYSNEASATPQASVSASAMHVSAISLTTANAGGGSKRGVAHVTIVDNLGNPVSGATVNGTFTGSYNESGSGVTDSSGVAKITTTNTAKGTVSFSFCVDSVSGALIYDPNSNTVTCSSI